MARIRVSSTDSSLIIVGHGLTINRSFDLAPGISVHSNVSRPDIDSAATGCSDFADYAAVVTGQELATFGIEVRSSNGGDQLAIEGWNALWNFHLLSIACGCPCFPLYAVTNGRAPLYTLTNRTPFVRPLPKIQSARPSQLAWAKKHRADFDRLTKVQQFSSALLCYGNAHYLPDLEVRIMLIWAGIEGLLSVDAELNRRLALYAAILHTGSHEEKADHFDRVKKAYDIRSRVVHGGRLGQAKLRDGYDVASRILAELLARCLELQRVPSPAELDRVAVTGSIE